MRWADFYQPDGFINEWRPGSFASDPSPDSGCLWIEEYLPRTSRATRLVSLDPRLDHPLALVEFTAEPEPETGLMFAFMRRHRCEPGKPNGIQWDFFGTYVRNPFWWDPPYPEFILWKKPLWALHPFNPVPKPALPSWDVFAYTRPYTWSYSFRYPFVNRWPGPHILKPVAPEARDIARREKEGRELIARGLAAWKKKRKPYVRPGRKTWASGWRSERKMRDLTARLKLENDGWDTSGRPDAVVPPRYNVKRMQETTTERARTKRKDWEKHRGINVRQQPERHKTERRYLYPAPGPSLRRLYKPPAPNGRRNGPSAASLPLPFPVLNPARREWCRI